MAHVSIIIPCYNQARSLRAAIDSALAQTHPDTEVIAVDDGSTDETPAILASYGDRIRIVTQPNRGLPAARNAGFTVAGGAYLLFLDSDDRLDPDAIAAHLAALEPDPQRALTYGGWRLTDPEGRVDGEVQPPCGSVSLEDLLLRRVFFMASAVLLRRSCFEAVGGFDQTLPWGEDVDLWLRLRLAGYNFGCIDRPLFDYRIHPHSLTASVDAGQETAWRRGLDHFFALPAVPAEVRALRPRIESVLHFETVGRYLRVGAVDAARRHLVAAFDCAPVDPDWFLEWVAGTALDPRTPDPRAFIAAAFDQLPPVATALRRLRRRAIGRYHAAAFFAAMKQRDAARARPHIIPALWHDPHLLTNRGFLRSILRALKG